MMLSVDQVGRVVSVHGMNHLFRDVVAVKHSRKLHHSDIRVFSIRHTQVRANNAILRTNRADQFQRTLICCLLCGESGIAVFQQCTEPQKSQLLF